MLPVDHIDAAKSSGSRSVDLDGRCPHVAEKKARMAVSVDGLMFAEWIRLAVVFEGHTWDEFTAKRPGGWVVASGHILEGARKLVRDTFSPDDPGTEQP